MGCNCTTGGLFNTDFDHTFDKSNSRCQDTDINEIEELKKFVEEVTKEGLEGIVDKQIDAKVKALENQIKAIDNQIKALELADQTINDSIKNIIDVLLPAITTDITTLRNNYTTLNTQVTNIMNQIEDGTIGGVNVIKSPTEPQDKTKGTIWIKIS